MFSFYAFVCVFTICCRPEEKIKLLEKKINELIEESCFAASHGEHQLVKLLLLSFICQLMKYVSFFLTTRQVGLEVGS